MNNLVAFVKTRVYRELFSERDVWSIVNECSPHISAKKRVERTLSVYNNFLNLIQEHVHVVISLQSCLGDSHLAHLFRKHSSVFADFYVDIYKPL
jgi:hypothetical protein